MATVSFKGLTGIYGTVTVDPATDTIDDLITAIAAEEGLDTNYYNISKLGNPDANSWTYGDSTTTLDDSNVDILDGDSVICTTNQTGSREFRQKQKLDIAAIKRSDTYDITQLPTQYSGNDIVDNPNVGGLVLGRPWA